MDDSKESLKVLRVKAGLTQVQLAKKIGVTPLTIRTYEKNVENFRKADYNTIENLAKELNVPVSKINLG